MNTLFGYLKSRTVWTLIILFVINGIEPIRESIPGNLLPVIDGVLGILGVYFRVSPKQNFNKD